MSARLRVFSSSVGSKILIGVTGLALFLYLILHIAGNLMVFFGPSVFNGYSHTMLSNPLIYPVEIGLLLIFLLHISKTVTMYLANQHARPSRYVKKKPAGPPSRKTFASSTMIVYLRLLAGLTSFISNLWRSHLPAIGPPGTRASSVMIAPRSAPRAR